MNNTQVNVKLTGFEGPFFPAIVAKLMETQDQLDIHSNYSMKEVASQILGFVAGDVYMTLDNYIWYYGLHFKSESGEMVVLLPDFGDLNQETCRMERLRSVAVYTNGVFDVESVLQQLIKGIETRSKFLIKNESARLEAESIATNISLDKYPGLRQAFDKFSKETELSTKK